MLPDRQAQQCHSDHIISHDLWIWCNPHRNANQKTLKNQYGVKKYTAVVRLLLLF